MRILFNVLLFLAITNLYAQNSIKGTVTDATTNQGIPYANIYLSELEKGTYTNENGDFLLENLPSGNRKIVVSILGYETKSINILIPTTNSLTISLTPTAIEMQAVIVSTPFHKLQSENVMKVEHQTIANLKANGAVNLADGITNIAGVESVTTGLSIGKPVIRGLSSNRVLVYAQGVRLENQQFGDEHGLGLSDSGIESVEVIKGPASLLYGSDALGGVLYINPEKFAQSNTSNADFNGNYFSNTQGFSTNAGYKSSDDHFKFLFRGSLTEHADYKTNTYRVTNTRFKEQDFKAGIGYQKEDFKTEFRYNVNHSKLGIPEEIGEQSTSKTPLLPFQDITNHVFSSKSSVFFNDSRLDINLGYIYNDRKEFEEHHHEEEGEEEEHEEELEDENEILEAALHMKLKTANYDVKYNLPKLGKFETIVGIQGMNQVNTNYGEEQLIPNATTNDFGVLATSHIHFEKADVQLGARFDNRTIDVATGLQKNFNSFNGALGLKTDIAKKVTARINLATGFRAPNLSELTSDGSHEGTNRYEIGNENLESEQNFQTDIALEFKNEHVEFFVNGFYNTINNYIYLSPNGESIDGDPVFVYLQNDANLYGGEVGLHIHPHPLDWLHMESSFETVTGKQTDDSYLPLIPANSVTNILRVEFERPWLKKAYSFVKLTTTFNQNNASAFETNTAGYSLLSAGLGGSFNLFKNEATVTLSGTNLTNKTYVNHLSRLKPDGIFNMGRNINIGLTYNL
ncbi:Heme/hemopexin utilization protein C precursor [Mariniflexile rhizosphaerae]|uniref:TonB-dependent receptor n=1 Tax=unclassified Mariniflexile TaxID=2643887 RepID=UPI000CBDE92B|nr:TonB-dependent receptor [Mariniflexile sp. TRM1-10]AXP83089.1 Heme/hemopexin utilization protein C precursor [Mariniflexile sp. TRM1-10]PLB18638.1 MAG: TonB-dependent Receptor Plug domain protein [Flavobacteriaceae bacterium FS1-H7996/R]